MGENRHKILGGKVTVFQRTEGGIWQVETFLDGGKRRASTGEDSLSRAKDFAEDWYLTLKGKKLAGEKLGEHTFKEAAVLYENDMAMLTHSRSEAYLVGAKARVKNHLVPFFGGLGLSQVTSAKIHEYRLRRQTPVDGKSIAHNTMHQEIVALRQILKRAVREGWLSHVPDMSAPYRANVKISHRAWFSADEYKQLYQASRAEMREAEGNRWAHEAAQMHDYILLMVNTGLRPDEMARVQYRDVEVAQDHETGETILIIQVRGKRGVGYCKSTANAVFTFERMVERNDPAPEDLLFPLQNLDRFNRILDRIELKFDREGQRRTPYSLRHTYISLRLLEGADIYQIAKNCRTSVEMIEKFYASHISTSISAAGVNVMRAPLSKAKKIDLERRNQHRFGKKSKNEPDDETASS